MAGDLSSEIEARKARIAELRRLRETHSRKTTPPATAPSQSDIVTQNLSVVAPAEALISISRPFLYPRSTQSDDIFTADQIHVDNASVDSKLGTLGIADVEPSPKETLGKGTEFTVQPLDKVSFPSLSSFLDNGWRAIARIGNQGARPIVDYTSPINASVNSENGSQDSLELDLVLSFEKSAKSIEWSPFFHDLIATTGDDPMKVYIWSIEAPERPEYTLRAPTKISKVHFSTQSPHLFYAGGHNGQLFMWDLKNTQIQGGGRFELLPQMRSAIGNAPIIALKSSSSALVSLAGDGTLCVWASLANPLHRISLEDTLRPALSKLKLSVLVPTSMALFYSPDFGYGLGYGTGLCVIGTLTGQLIRMPSSETAPVKAYDWNHHGPVSALEFRPKPLYGENGASGVVLLSSGLDWRVSLWYVPFDEDAAPFNIANIAVNYAVSSVAWHPTLSTVFATAGESEVQVWDLHRSSLSPVLSLTKDNAEISSVAFGRTSGMVAVSGSSFVSLFSFDARRFEDNPEWLKNLVNEKRT